MSDILKIHPFQYPMMTAAHRTKSMGYNVKVLSDKATNFISLVFAYNKDTIYYLSAMDYVNEKSNAAIRYGTAIDDGDEITLNETGSCELHSLLEMLKCGELYPVSSSPGERENDVRIISTDTAFARWADDNGYSPYIRAYRSAIGAEDIHYTTAF